MNLNEILTAQYVRALIYSPSGTGKTTVAALTALYPELRPVYVADWDMRIESLRARVPQEYWQYVISDPYRDVVIGGEAFTKFQSKVEKLEGEGIKTLVIDSGTFCMKAIMNRVLTLAGKPTTDTPQLQNYMQQQSLLEDLVAKTCAKKLNFIFTCHEDTSKDEVTGRLFKAVDLTGKMANRIPGYFNEIWHCEVTQSTGREPEFRVRTRSDQTYAARTSFKSLDSLEKQELIWPKILAERTQQNGAQ